MSGRNADSNPAGRLKEGGAERVVASWWVVSSLKASPTQRSLVSRALRICDRGNPCHLFSNHGLGVGPWSNLPSLSLTPK